MQRRLAARDLQQVRLAFRGDQGVHHRLDGGEIAAVLRRRRGTRETGRAGEIAVRVDLKDSQARVLLVIGAQAAIVGTTKIGAAVVLTRSVARLEKRLGQLKIGGDRKSTRLNSSQ